jgi:hypothetical protein
VRYLPCEIYAQRPNARARVLELLNNLPPRDEGYWFTVEHEDDCACVPRHAGGRLVRGRLADCTCVMVTLEVAEAEGVTRSLKRGVDRR